MSDPKAVLNILIQKYRKDELVQFVQDIQEIPVEVLGVDILTDPDITAAAKFERLFLFWKYITNRKNDDDTKKFIEGL